MVRLRVARTHKVHPVATLQPKTKSQTLEPPPGPRNLKPYDPKQQNPYSPNPLKTLKKP